MAALIAVPLHLLISALPPPVHSSVCSEVRKVMYAVVTSEDIL